MRLFFLLIFCIIAATKTQGANISDQEKIVVLEIVSNRALEEVVTLIKNQSNLEKVDWDDLVGYWKTDNKIYLMISSKKIQGPQGMTNAQWIVASLIGLQKSKILELKSSSEVVLNHNKSQKSEETQSTPK